MVSGAAKAEAALLVIDAREGVKENSKRHGYLLSMLGIKQVIVCINKMDLINYNKEKFTEIKEEYTSFLKKIGITPKTFIPISAVKGENIIKNSKKLEWFKGHTVLTALDSFRKEESLDKKPLRMPIQDIYKFTGKGDNRRVVAGRIESGTLHLEDKVVFIPSNKHSRIKSIEEFSAPKIKELSAGNSAGLTLTEQIYIKRGEIMCKEGEITPFISSIFKCNIFWMANEPMDLNKEYTLKICTEKKQVKLKEIINVLDASTLTKSKKNRIEKHDVAECILKSSSQLAFDLFNNIKATGRFVLVDNFDIAGGGIITEFIEDKQAKLRKQIFLREEKWEHSMILPKDRAEMYGQTPKLILITGVTGVDKKTIAKHLEKRMFESGRKVYFLGIGNLLRGLDSDIDKKKRIEHIRRLGEVVHILMDAGLIVIATASDLNEDELKLLKTISREGSTFIINVDHTQTIEKIIDLNLKSEEGTEKNVIKILDFMRFKNIIFDP